MKAKVYFFSVALFMSLVLLSGKSHLPSDHGNRGIQIEAVKVNQAFNRGFISFNERQFLLGKLNNIQIVERRAMRDGFITRFEARRIQRLRQDYQLSFDAVVHARNGVRIGSNHHRNNRVGGHGHGRGQGRSHGR